MKHLLPLLFSLFILFIPLSSLKASASSLTDIQAELSEDAEAILSDNDIGLSLPELSNMSFRELCSMVLESFRERMRMPLRIFGCILVLSVMYQLADGFSGSRMKTGSILSLVASLVSASLIAVPLLGVYDRASSSVRLTASFTLVYIPVFTAVTALSGCIASAGMYHIMILGASELIIRISEDMLMPVLALCTVLAICGSIFPDSPGEALVKLLRRVMNTAVTVVSVLFSGFLSLRCSLAGSADSAADKTAKMLLSGSVPVIGGAVSDAYASVKGSLGVMRSTIGTAGVIAVLLILLPPLAEIIMFRAAIWAGSAIADIMKAVGLSSMMRTLDDALSLVQCVMVSQCGMLVICTAVFMNALN